MVSIIILNLKCCELKFVLMILKQRFTTRTLPKMILLRHCLTIQSSTLLTNRHHFVGFRPINKR